MVNQGLRGDSLEALHRMPPFAIKPRRGDYVLFDENAEMRDSPIGQVLCSYSSVPLDCMACTTCNPSHVLLLPHICCANRLIVLWSQVPSATSRGVYVWKSGLPWPSKFQSVPVLMLRSRPSPQR